MQFPEALQNKSLKISHGTFRIKCSVKFLFPPKYSRNIQYVNFTQYENFCDTSEKPIVVMDLTWVLSCNRSRELIYGVQHSRGDIP